MFPRRAKNIFLCVTKARCSIKTEKCLNLIKLSHKYFHQKLNLTSGVSCTVHTDGCLLPLLLQMLLLWYDVYNTIIYLSCSTHGKIKLIINYTVKIVLPLVVLGKVVETSTESTNKVLAKYN